MRASLLAIVLAVAAAACTGQTQSSTSGSDNSPAPAAATIAPAVGQSDTMKIKLAGMNGSGESGTATLTRLGAKTRVVIALKGEAALGKQPAHVHKGTCAHLDPKPTYPLHDVVGGTSMSVIDASFDQLTATPMAINVHESYANIGKYVACGDIL